MPNKFRPTTQISDDHCGPAVIQMLLDNLGVEVSQENITKAAGVEKTIKGRGTRIDQLALAVNVLAPSTRLWYKEKASLEDLIKVLEEYEHPVGVEWQGIFEDISEEDDEEEEDDDAGHYSIISHIDTANKQLIIIDPYKDFVNQSRIIPIDTFLRRWWDYNEVLQVNTREPKFVVDTQLFFIVTRAEETFPESLGMTKYY